MKLSAVLAISVPIAAASQLPAVAADAPPPVGGSAQWQNSVAPQRAQMASISYALAQKQVPVAAHVAHASPTSAGLKLRPFKPGRYLPSERDLRAAAMPQQAQYDPSADQAGYATGGAMLSGQVSSQYAAPRAASAYDQYAMNPGALAAVAMPIAQRVKAQVKRAIGQRAPQMVPNRMPVMPAQFSQQAAMVQTAGPEPMMQQRQMRPSSMPCGPMPMQMAQQMPTQMQMQQQQMMQQFQQMQMQQQMSNGMQPMQQMQMQQMPMQQMPMQQTPMQQMPMQQMQSSQNFAPADISPAEANAMLRQVVANPPQAKLGINGELIGQALDNPGNGAGQPPFPLNFLGGNALGQLTQAQHRPQQNVPQARFGSWHGGPGLASAGFHSYVHRRKPTMYEYTRAPMPTSRSTKSASAAPGLKRSMSAPPTVAHTSSGPKPIRVATYGGSYRSAY